jgi:ABC-type polysaccharide/polyol phosphate transport system ATPase subunit
VTVRVRAEGLSKRFYLLKKRRTVVETIGLLVRGEPLAREHWVLRDVSFQIDRGDKVALIGRNGAGKSTLLRILSGIYSATTGTLLVTGSPSPLLSSSAGLRHDLTVLENLYLFGAVHRVPRRTLRELEQSILERTELAHLAHSSLKELSVGQVQRLALTVYSATPSEFLILDEVIGHVDHGFRQEFYRFFAALAESPKTLIMTSHDAPVLRRFCQKALWLDGGTVRRFGPVHDVLDEYEDSFRANPSKPAYPIAVHA